MKRKKHTVRFHLVAPPTGTGVNSTMPSSTATSPPLGVLSGSSDRSTMDCYFLRVKGVLSRSSSHFLSIVIRKLVVRIDSAVSY